MTSYGGARGPQWWPPAAALTPPVIWAVSKALNVPLTSRRRLGRHGGRWRCSCRWWKLLGVWHPPLGCPQNSDGVDRDCRPRRPKGCDSSGHSWVSWGGAERGPGGDDGVLGAMRAALEAMVEPCRQWEGA